MSTPLRHLVKPRHLLRRQSVAGGFYRFTQLFRITGANNRRSDERIGQHPGQRGLGDSPVMLLPDFFHYIGEAEVGLREDLCMPALSLARVLSATWL